MPPLLFKIVILKQKSCFVADCYDVASTYRGIIAQTENGEVCQHWWKNFPHDHDYHDDTTFPDDSTVAAHNYCRAPDDDPVPWCYTEDPDVRWGYCDVPKCDSGFCYLL